MITVEDDDVDRLWNEAHSGAVVGPSAARTNFRASLQALVDRVTRLSISRYISSNQNNTR